MDLVEKSSMFIKISNVFRPGAPIDESTLFAGRLDQIHDVMSGIVQAGRHVIMFGERGVGKTSLAKVMADFLSKAGLQVLNSGTINCDGTDDFHGLWHKVFRELSVIMRSKQIGFAGESPQR
jgi:ABC-type multidrug transport system ATPase subunit